MFRHMLSAAPRALSAARPLAAGAVAAGVAFSTASSADVAHCHCQVPLRIGDCMLAP